MSPAGYELATFRLPRLVIPLSRKKWRKWTTGVVRAAIRMTAANVILLIVSVDYFPKGANNAAEQNLQLF